MPSALPAGNAHVANNASHPSAWHKDSQAFGPYLVHLIEKSLIGCDVAELPLMIGVLDQRRVRRAGANKVHTFSSYKRKIASITFDNTMFSYPR